MRDLDTPPRFGRLLSAALLAVGAAVFAGWHTLVAADEIEDLRGHIPTGEELRDELADLARSHDELLVALNGAERDLRATLDARLRFSADQRRLAQEIEEATAHLRSVAVRSFVEGGPVSKLGYLLAVTEASELSWRQHLLRNHAGAAELAIVRLRTWRPRQPTT